MSTSSSVYKSRLSLSTNDDCIITYEAEASARHAEQLKAEGLCALSQSILEPNTLSSPDIENQEKCVSDLSLIGNTSTVGSGDIAAWKQPTSEFFQDNLLSLLEEEACRDSSISYSGVSLLTRLTLQAPMPPCTADELLKTINNIEIGLLFLLSISIPEIDRIHSTKSISEIDISKSGFIKSIKSCIRKKHAISENYIYALRDMVISEASIFKSRSIKSISNINENEDFIISTKQSLLSYAVEENLIHIFKEEIDQIKFKFIFLIPFKSDISGPSEHELEISERERIAILIHMLMCYAKLVEKVIFEEKTKCLGAFFVKFGHIYITNAMSTNLHSVVKELHKIVPILLTKKYSMIKEEEKKKGCLNDLFIRKIISIFTKSKEIKILLQIAKAIVLKSCHKIVINTDQLIPKSNVIIEYIESVFLYNLVESLEVCIRCNISNILPNNLPHITQEKSSSLNKELTITTLEAKGKEDSKILPTDCNDIDSSTTLPCYVKTDTSSKIFQSKEKRLAVHIPVRYHCPEESKKFNNSHLYSLAKKCVNMETLGTSAPPNSSLDLFESIKKFELDLLSPLLEQQNHISIRPHPAKSMLDVGCSSSDFIRFIKDLIGKKVSLSTIRNVPKLRKEVLLEVKELELMFLRIASNEKEVNNFIKETNQHYLASAIEEKLIIMFKFNIITAKERFYISLQKLQGKLFDKDKATLRNLRKLIISEKNQYEIMVHMLMCYARLSDDLIGNKKVMFSDLEKFFIKIGQVYVTKYLHWHLEMIKREFHENNTNNALKINVKLIEERFKTTGILDRLLIDNIINKCMKDNKSFLEEKIKSTLSEHCSKVAISNDELITLNPVIEEHLVNELFVSLREEMGSIILESSTKHLERCKMSLNHNIIENM